MTTSTEGGLPALVPAVRAGPAGLVHVAAELADAGRGQEAAGVGRGVTRGVTHGPGQLWRSTCVVADEHRGRRVHAALLWSSRSTLTPSTKVAPAGTRATRWAPLTQRQRAWAASRSL